MKNNKHILIVYILLILNYVSFSQINPQNFSSYEYENANAFNISLEEICTLDIEKKFGPGWNIFFLESKNQIVYSRTSPVSNSHEIVIKDLKTLKVILNFKGSRILAISPDENRIFYDNAIYDIKQRKKYELGVSFYNHYYWKNGTIFWLSNNRIISYKNVVFNGRSKPNMKYYYYLDLDDLKIKKLSDSEIYEAFAKVEHRNPLHNNFYIYKSGSIFIQDKKTPYCKKIVEFNNGFPIGKFWSSSNLEYLVVRKYTQRYRDELILYKLKNSIKTPDIFFSSSTPIKLFDNSFKPIFNETNGVGIWVSVYEEKINPLNNKAIGPDRSKYIGDMQIIKSLDNGKVGLQMGYDNNNKIKSGFIITNFRKNSEIKDRNGVWTKLYNWDFIKPCNLTFPLFSVGDVSNDIFYIHTILNVNPKTIIVKSGVLSPGNEHSEAVEKTIIGIKKLQKTYGLKETGVVDTKTRNIFKKLCSILHKQEALKTLK